MRGKAEFTKLVIGQKRVRNILKNVKGLGKVSTELLKRSAEKKLYKKGMETDGQLNALFEARDYQKVLDLLLAMRPNIDKFFDDVLVMCEDEKLKKNRLALVSLINRIFLRFGDLSKIVIEGEKN
jgi:glycyl-tRNA synthetase beta chain